MRVAIGLISPPEDQVYGGGSTYSRNLLKTLVERADVTPVPIYVRPSRELRVSSVYHPIDGVPGVELELPFKQVPLVAPPYLNALDVTSSRRWQRLLDSLAYALAMSQVDCLHLIFWGQAALALPYAAHQLGVPIVHTAFDYLSFCPRGFLHFLGREPCSGPETMQKCAMCIGHGVRPRSRSLFRGAMRLLPTNAFQLRRTLAAVMHRLVPQVTEQDAFIGSPSYLNIRLASTTHMLLHCDRVIAFHPIQSKHLRQWHDLPEETVTVVPLAAPSPGERYQKTAGAFEYPLKVLFVGRNSEQWGLRFLLRAWGSLGIDPNRAVLHIYTNQGTVDEIGRDKQAERLLQAGAVFHEERVGETDILDGIHGDAALQIVPSMLEDYGSLSLLEAMVRRTPVLVPDRFGCYDWMRDCGGGFSYEFRNEKELARSLHELLEAPSMLRTRSERMSCGWSWSNYVDELVREYSRAVTRRRAQGESTGV